MSLGGSWPRDPGAFSFREGTMDIEKKDLENIKKELRHIGEVVGALQHDRGHTFIILALWILLLRGCYG